MVDNLRRSSVAIYLAAEMSAAEEISKKLRDAGDEIERLGAENRVMFWLIIVINTAVAGLLTLAYRIL